MEGKGSPPLKETKEQNEETGPGMPPVGMDEATENSDPVVTSPRPATRDSHLQRPPHSIPAWVTAALWERFPSW